MNKVISLEFIEDGSGFHFIFEDKTKSRLYSSKREGMKALVDFSIKGRVDIEKWDSLSCDILFAKKLRKYEYRKPQIRNKRKLNLLSRIEKA